MKAAVTQRAYRHAQDARPPGRFRLATPGNVTTSMDDAQLLRYSRHILLPELGIDAQEKFAAAHALIVGAGGLGAPAAQFLAAAGVGTITLCDPDAVDLTNLQRQILFATADVGAAQGRRREASASPRSIPTCASRRVAARVGPDELAPLVARADVVLDCSDNFATRHAVNRACVAAKKPLVSGAAIRFDGQVAVFDTARSPRPCYHCLFGEGEELEETRCAIMGVFAPLVGIIGATQAAEALKLVAGVGENDRGPPAAARRAGDALARGARLARSGLVRSAATPAHERPVSTVRAGAAALCALAVAVGIALRLCAAAAPAPDAARGRMEGDQAGDRRRSARASSPATPTRPSRTRRPASARSSATPRTFSRWSKRRMARSNRRALHRVPRRRGDRRQRHPAAAPRSPPTTPCRSRCTRWKNRRTDAGRSPAACWRRRRCRRRKPPALRFQFRRTGICAARPSPPAAAA